VTDDYLETTDYAQVQKEAQAAGDWFAHWDAMGIVRRYQASSQHDVTKPFGGDLKQALQRVTAKVLVLPCSQDRLLGVEGAKDLAQGITQATYREVDSNWGHLAWRPVPESTQTNVFTSHIREFLGLA
jgi:homoserine acetyltransferase